MSRDRCGCVQRKRPLHQGAADRDRTQGLWPAQPRPTALFCSVELDVAMQVHLLCRPLWSPRAPMVTRGYDRFSLTFKSPSLSLPHHVKQPGAKGPE